MKIKMMMKKNNLTYEGYLIKIVEKNEKKCLNQKEKIFFPKLKNDLYKGICHFRGIFIQEKKAKLFNDKNIFLFI